MINLENLIDLPLLQAYDKDIKDWVKGITNIQFVASSDLPQQGEKNRLYIVVDDNFSMKVWDGSQYVEPTTDSNSDSMGVWGSF